MQRAPLDGRRGRETVVLVGLAACSSPSNSAVSKSLAC